MKKNELWLLRNLEGLIILVILISVMLINFFIYSKVAFLNFYYLPVIVGGYYLGQRMAVLGAFFSILMVWVFVLANQELYLFHSTKFDLYFNLTVWGGFLVITAWVIGYLAEKLRQDLNTSNKLRVELERSNQDLEDFAFIASHDLQEPLRKIHLFGDLLNQSSENTLDPKSQNHVNRMLVSTRRAQSYLNDLLSYSQIRSNAQSNTPVNLNKIIADVLLHFSLAIKKTNAQVQAGDFPTVIADQYMMRQLFQNLIGNALKFAKAGQPPKIKIYESPNNSEFYKIIVQDEGIGFDTSYLNNMVKPFKKLHGKDQYEGGGMGLTICMKVVRAHGGQMTANSKPGVGSQFIIHLPRKPVNIQLPVSNS